MHARAAMVATCLRRSRDWQQQQQQQRRRVHPRRCGHGASRRRAGSQLATDQSRCELAGSWPAAALVAARAADELAAGLVGRAEGACVVALAEKPRVRAPAVDRGGGLHFIKREKKKKKKKKMKKMKKRKEKEKKK